jgi:hypothetical protein
LAHLGAAVVWLGAFRCFTARFCWTLSAVALWQRQRLGSFRECCRTRSIKQPTSDVSPDRLLDVLDLLRAEVGEGQRQNLLYLLIGSARDADAARLRQCLQTRRDVHTITKQITVLARRLGTISKSRPWSRSWLAPLVHRSTHQHMQVCNALRGRSDDPLRHLRFSGGSSVGWFDLMHRRVEPIS